MSTNRRITDYSLDDVNGDTSFNQFNINNQPSDVFDILSDIKVINRYLRVIIAPWSPPAWMKDGGTMNGGALETQYATQCTLQISTRETLLTTMIMADATYFLKAVQGFESKGISVYGVSIQVCIITLAWIT